ncbi:ABC transporter substrate-binding protein [Gilvimarinus sp. DA14]|uniref:ABC transporter substrate-binding protein n=1 Tax=Gilvimarinus sp. DA14 TaxID=2956798 RepID=UPI0020B90013|nr:ABC transporter substrate-binding protein [Gilvimarinus sp. DA14]UTF58592.1 ABC transporter substrate-binding protein [Gilvimarinus sp. DA14]
MQGLWAGLLLSATSAMASAETLNVVSWDGAYVKSQILGYIRPYEEASGNRVNVLHYTGGIDEIRSQARAWNVSWEVVDLELYDAIRACKEGLLETIDLADMPAAPDGTPAEDDFINGQVTPCGVPNVASATVISFDPERFDNPPGSVKDFFDLDTYPGKRALRKTPQGNLEWALIADGVAADDVYKVLGTEKGLNRAFAVLDRMKPNLLWWETGQEAIRLLATEQVLMSSAYNGRVGAAIDRGESLDILWDNHVWYYDVWAIVKNGRNPELALDFIRYASKTESLAEQVNYISYGPMRHSAVAMLDKKVRERLPTSEAHLKNALELDSVWWSENLDRIKPRFDRWVDRPVMVPKALPR